MAIITHTTPADGTFSATGAVAWNADHTVDPDALKAALGITTIPGADGQDGADGFPGQAGAAGPAGADGLQGFSIRGEDGQDGETSYIPGPAGPAGPAASDPFIGSYAPGSFTIPTGKYAVMSNRLQLTTTQRITVAGTGRLRIT